MCLLEQKKNANFTVYCLKPDLFMPSAEVCTTYAWACPCYKGGCL